MFFQKKTLFDFPNKKPTKAKTNYNEKINYKKLSTQFQGLGNFHKTLNPKTQLQKQTKKIN